MDARPAYEPPTVGDLRSLGITGLQVTCSGAHCFHSAAFEFGRLHIPDATRFPDIRGLLRFVCTSCGAREFHIMPDWRGYRAQGMGR